MRYMGIGTQAWEMVFKLADARSNAQIIGRFQGDSRDTL